MAEFDWRALKTRAGKQFGRVPKWAWIAAGSLVFAAVLFAILASGGPPYTPLYEGLSPKQGGEVIENLQKLGIPYQLSATGNVISVPKPDLARARLELGQAGVPADSGSEAWQELTKGSLTEGSAAISALSQRVLESSLEKGIDGISGVASSQVSLALPKSTPFLGDQPQPKASVWLHTTGNGVSPTQARAIAQMVANSVPGLDVAHVTVTDQDGNVLAPLAHTGYDQEQQQLEFREQVERTAQARIEGLLATVVGAANVRVSVSAAVDFDQISARKVQYGPARIASHVKHNSERRIGSNDAAIGVPGALANEPPPDAAIAGPGTRGANNATGKAGQASAGPTLPSSASSSSDIAYDVDEATTVSKGAPWHVRAMSVSVVLNRSVAGADLAPKVKDIVTTAISAPNLKVNVAAVPFNLQRAPAAGHPGIIATLSNSNLIRAALALLAALLLFFAVARPLARAFKKGAAPQPRMAESAAPAAADEGTPAPRTHPDVTEKVRRSVRVATDRPADAAETLKRWLGEPHGNEAAAAAEEAQS